MKRKGEVGLRPLSDQVVVRVLPLEESDGLVWIPGTANHGLLPIRRGVVVALGSGDLVAPKCGKCEGNGQRNDHKCADCHGTGFMPHERTGFSVKVGDQVIFHPRGWSEYKVDGSDYIVLHEDQGILAVLEETISFHPVTPREARPAQFEGGALSSRQ